MIDKNIVVEYESVLIGKKKDYAQFLFKKNKIYDMDMALTIMKYAIETYLRWNPIDVRNYLTKEILELLKVDTLLKYIIFPTEIDCEEDMFFIAWRLYPETIHYSEEDLILRVYKNILDKKIKKYPKEFFSGIEGLYRANVCLKYMIEQYLVVDNIEELYKTFGGRNINAILKKYKLDLACKDLFDSPIDYLYQTLSDKQQITLLYKYYEFERYRLMQNKENLKNNI